MKKHALAVLAATVILAGCSGKVKAQFQVLTPKEALETVLATGRVSGGRVVPLAFQRSGRVARVKAAEGAVVKTGDTLLVLDNLEEKNRLAQALTAVEIARLNFKKNATTVQASAVEAVTQAQTQADLAQKQFERLSALLAQGAVAQADVDRARQDADLSASRLRDAGARLEGLQDTDQRLLLAQVAQAQSLADEARIALYRTALCAPENGTLVKLDARLGSPVSAGNPVASFLPADTTVHVELTVDEDALRGIRPGQKARVGLSASPETAYEAVVRDVRPLIDAGSGTGVVQLSLLSRADDLLPDQTVTAEVVTGVRDGVVSVEQRFMSFEKGAAFVFVLRKGRAARTGVSVTDLGNGRFVIESGAVSGDTLLFAAGLKDGVRVALINGL